MLLSECRVVTKSTTHSGLEWNVNRIARFTLLVLGLFLVPTYNAFGQNSSLFHRPVAYLAQSSTGPTAEELPAPPEPKSAVQMIPQAVPNLGQQPYPPNQFQAQPFPTPMENAGGLGLQTSWTFLPPAPARSLKLHDIVSIRIEETSTSLSTGNASSRKTTIYDVVLKDWLRLVGLDTIKPAPQSDGDPKILSLQNEVYRADSSIRTSESFTRNIAAEIVDIKPNGLIVLDATKTIKENDNSWRYSLTGTCRSQDIGPDNVVLSRNLIHSQIDKQDMGHLRDGYSRGWLTKLVARIKPY